MVRDTDSMGAGTSTTLKGRPGILLNVLKVSQSTIGVADLASIRFDCRLLCSIFVQLEAKRKWEKLTLAKAFLNVYHRHPDSRVSHISPQDCGP